MLQARSIAEAALYLEASGLDPRGLQLRRSEGDMIAWHSATDGSQAGPAFVLWDKAPSLLDAAVWRELGGQAARCVPEDVALLTSRSLGQLLKVLDHALACLHEAELLGDPDHRLRQRLEGRRDRLEAARGDAPPAPGTQALGEELRHDPARLAPWLQVPYPVARLAAALAEGWCLVDDAIEGRPGQALLRGPGGAGLWVEVAGDQVVAAHPTEGPPGLAEMVRHGWHLTPAARAAAHAALHPGTTLQTALTALQGHGLRLRPVAWLPDATPPASWWIVDEVGRRHRTALLLLLEQGAQDLAGYQLFEGVVGFEQLQVLLERAAMGIVPDEIAFDLVRQRMAEELERLLRTELQEGRMERLIARMRPRPGDLEAAFRATRHVYDPAPYPRAPGREGPPQIALASTEQLVQGAAEGFEPEWTTVASMLQPGRLWASVRLPHPVERGDLLFDGIVWLEDHWAWFPTARRTLVAGD